MESRTKEKLAVSGVAAAALLARKLLPGTLDLVDLSLVAVTLLPWLADLVKSAELPGGLKIEFQDVQKAADKVSGGAHVESSEPATLYIAEGDPNLALVGLRIEIEKRLRALAEIHGLPRRASLAGLFAELQTRGVLNDPALSGLRELIRFGNEAAHGAEVGPEVANWAIDYGPSVLGVLDRALGDAER